MTVIDTDKKYSILLVDPPWDYKNWNKKWHQEHAESRWAGRKYDLMDTEHLKQLNVNDIADKNAVLFLWTISTMLPEALDVIKAWGFTYKTVAFVWVKKNKIADSFFWGMGFWTRSNTEICLLAVKGKPLPRVSRSVHQIVYSSVRKHSQKPDEVRDKIVELLGDIPRIELFARERAEGWDSHGNELPEDI